MLDCLNYLDSLQIPYGTAATAIGGGTKGMLWLQMLSDVLGITLRTTLSGDSSLGSAMLAGIAVGVFADATDAVSKCVKEKDVVYPNSKNTEEYRKLFAAYKKIHDALAPVYQERAL
jgi:xylulokinase